jgi:hypothetical protein
MPWAVDSKSQLKNPAAGMSTRFMESRHGQASLIDCFKILFHLFIATRTSLYVYSNSMIIEKTA